MYLSVHDDEKDGDDGEVEEVRPVAVGVVERLVVPEELHLRGRVGKEMAGFFQRVFQRVLNGILYSEDVPPVVVLYDPQYDKSVQGEADGVGKDLQQVADAGSGKRARVSVDVFPDIFFF